MWPGTLSIAPKLLPLGGTAMYALLALAGDVGCSAGPTLVGFVSGAFGENLKIGILAACIFPLLILFCLFKGNLGKETK
jgi:MFS-type transporter involved in bile tolerance (Atg22 family)